MIMDINKRQDEIIEEFSDFDEWMDSYSLLIYFGNQIEHMEEKLKTPERLIEGCQSRVWLDATIDDSGHIHFKADSDAMIVKGIIALLTQVLQGATPDEILDTPLYFIDKIGLSQHLSPTRSNALLSMVKQIKMYAHDYNATHNAESGT